MDDVVEYMNANRARYTREAISEQLLASGHDREAIARAWEVSDAAARGAGEMEAGPTVEEYIRANGPRFAREAITSSLVQAGHDSAEVDRVWEAVQLERSARDLVSFAKVLFWLGFFAVAGSLLFWIWFIDALGSQGAGTAVPDLADAALIVGAYAVVGFVVLRVTRWVAWRRTLGGFLSFAAYLGVLVAMAAATFGTCIGGIAVTGS